MLSDIPKGWTSIIVDLPDMAETICKDATRMFRVLIGLTSVSDSLNGYWGKYDVQDCQEAATILADKKYIDGNRVAIRGGSAGAYTTLSSVTFAPSPTLYKTACGAYGCVADVQHLTDVTEKFEMRYCYTLFASAPSGGAWDPRNPIDHASNIKVPLLVCGALL